jgi:anti-anti-sigma factor
MGDIVKVQRSETDDKTLLLRLTGVFSDERETKPDLGVLTSEDYARPLLVSLRDVTLLNSTGIGLLLNLNRQTKEHGGRLVLVNVPAYVRQVLDYMRLGNILLIAKTDQEASEMLR